MSENQSGARWHLGERSPVPRRAASCSAGSDGEGQSEPGLAADISHPSFPVPRGYFTPPELTNPFISSFSFLASRAGRGTSRAATTQPCSGGCWMRPRHRGEGAQTSGVATISQLLSREEPLAHPQHGRFPSRSVPVPPLRRAGRRRAAVPLRLGGSLSRAGSVPGEKKSGQGKTKG